MINQNNEELPERFLISKSKDPVLHYWVLQTEQGAFLGRFPSAEEAEAWCRRNGYRSQIIAN